MVLPIRYRMPNGIPVISTTQILTLAGRIDATWYTPACARRGTTIHAMTEAIDRGAVFDLPYEWRGYRDAYYEFLRTCRPVYLATELEVVSEEHGFGGRLDRVVRMLGQDGILDFKTGGAEPWHGQQLAAYNLLHPVGQRWGCYLSPDGKFWLRHYTDPRDHRHFLYDLARTRGTVLANGTHWVVVSSAHGRQE